ncbi:MAG: hypothetical protein LBK04_04685 [Clostridiales Family XIII bacterium]|nr:hypothetical protein [Clostridiales Family XIII bacterium]
MYKRVDDGPLSAKLYPGNDYLTVAYVGFGGIAVNGPELREKLIRSHMGSYDLSPWFKVGNTTYDAYARFDVTSAKYVLVKKAELYRAHSFEHTFIRVFDEFLADDLYRFKSQIDETIEPGFVREGKPYPMKDHMYSFITGLFISEMRVGEEARRAVRKFRYVRNYLLSIRGYCLCRIVLFDLEDGIIFGNPAAQEVVKGYKKARYI